MRSLRARIFLTVWPLFVVAIVIVGAVSSRSARTELQLFESRLPPMQPADAMPRTADSVAALWPAMRERSATGTLQRLASTMGDGVALLLVDSAGSVIAASDASLARAEVVRRADGTIDLSRRVEADGRQMLQRLVLSGTPVVSRDQQRLGDLYLLPSGMPQPSGAQRMVAGIQRSLWGAVLLACVLAAAGTWLLAYPIVAQVQRLTSAASRVQNSAFATRVTVSSRDELGALEQSFNRMAASLEQTESAKRQLISDVAHELRTPLTNVIGLLEAMRDGLRPADATTLQAAQHEASLLTTLIDELQVLALADAGGLQFDMQPLDARVEVERAVAAFQASVPAIQLLASDTPMFVMADARRLAQVLRNVLQNAITHTPADGNVTVSLRAERDTGAIVIADTGRGIPAEHLPLIWERFYRVDPSRDRTTGGMGLGLALTKRLVEGMGGTVSAASDEGVGTTMTIRLVRRSS
jgi:signal transduction histidine kinase